MAEYKRYQKLQKYYLGVPVEPAEYKEGELIGIKDYNSIEECEQDLVWRETDGYICEVQTDGKTYYKYKKLLGYHSDGTPTNPEIYKKGDLISSDCKLETCGEDIILVEYDPVNNKVYTKKSIDCGNTFDIINEKTYDTVKSNVTNLSNTTNGVSVFLGKDDNIHYIQRNVNKTRIWLGTINKEDGTMERIELYDNSNNDLSEWLYIVSSSQGPFDFDDLSYYDGTNLYLFKGWKKYTGYSVQAGLQVLIYNTETGTFTISDKIYSDEKIAYTQAISIKSKRIIANANEVFWVFSLNSEEGNVVNDGIYIQRFNYNNLGEIIPTKLHYLKIKDVYEFERACVNYHTNEIIIPFKKNNPLYSEKSTIEYNYYRYVASLPKTQDEDIVEIRIDEGWTYDVTNGGEYVYKWATPSFIYGNNDAFHKYGYGAGIDITKTRDFFIENDTNKTFTINGNTITEAYNKGVTYVINEWFSWFVYNDLMIAYMQTAIKTSGSSTNRLHVFKIN